MKYLTAVELEKLRKEVTVVEIEGLGVTELDYFVGEEILINGKRYHRADICEEQLEE